MYLITQMSSTHSTQVTLGANKDGFSAEKLKTEELGRLHRHWEAKSKDLQMQLDEITAERDAMQLTLGATKEGLSAEKYKTEGLGRLQRQVITKSYLQCPLSYSARFGLIGRVTLTLALTFSICDDIR